MISIKNPNTKEFFNKDSIREVIRPWFNEVRKNNWSVSELDMEENIELLQQCYMNSLHRFVNDSRIMYTSQAYYKKFLKGERDAEYIGILQNNVKRLFLETCLDKSFRLDLRYTKYLCLQTVEGLFYKGEIYKHFDDVHFCLDKSLYGYKEEDAELHLIPDQGRDHYTIDKELKPIFKKI
jgi:hypothetical protein